jgi:hypothetical protein
MTQSAYTFIMQQEGPNVIIEGSGSINLAGLSFGRTGNYPEGFMEPSTGIILVNGASDFYSGITGSSSFGPGGQIRTENPIGHPVSVLPGDGQLGVPQGYVSGGTGDTLSNGMTFAGATLASLGVTPGTYVWTWASGSLTLFIVPS